MEGRQRQATTLEPKELARLFNERERPSLHRGVGDAGNGGAARKLPPVATSGGSDGSNGIPSMAPSSSTSAALLQPTLQELPPSLQPTMATPKVETTKQPMMPTPKPTKGALPPPTPPDAAAATTATPTTPAAATPSSSSSSSVSSPSANESAHTSSAPSSWSVLSSFRPQRLRKSDWLVYLRIQKTGSQTFWQIIQKEFKSSIWHHAG